MTKTQAISEAIMMKFIETGSMEIAFDDVMGKGAYKNLASDLYDRLNGNAETTAP